MTKRMARKCRTSASMLTAAVLAAMSSGAYAGTYYWDNTAGAGLGGTGTWNTSNTNWNTDPTGADAGLTAWPNGSDTAIFGGAVNTEVTTLGTNVNANSIIWMRPTNVGTGPTINGTSVSITMTGSNPSIGTAAFSNNNNGMFIGVPVLASAPVTLFQSNIATSAAVPTLGFRAGSTSSFAGGVNVNAAALRIYLNSSNALGGATVTVNATLANGYWGLNSIGANGQNIGGILFSQNLATAGTYTQPNNFVLNPTGTAGAHYETGFGSGTAGVLMNYTGQISGTSDVVITTGILSTIAGTGAGIVIFGNTNSYSGDTYIQTATDGLLRIGSGGGLPTGTRLVFGRGIANSATSVTLGGVDLFGNNISLTSLRTNFGSSIASSAKGIGNSNSGAGGTITITGGDTTTYASRIGTFSVAASNSFTATTNLALTLAASHTGTLILTGTSDYAGATTINSGTLVLANASANTLSASNVTVGTGASPSATPTLASGASGSLSGNVTLNSGGVIAGGNVGSVGSLTIGGTLAVNGGSKFHFDLVSPGSSDQVSITGLTTLDAGTHTIDFAAPPSGVAVPGTYTLINYTGGVSGTNTFVNGTQPNGLTYLITPSGSNVQVGVTGKTPRWSVGATASPTEGAGTWSNGGGNFIDSQTTSAYTYANGDNFDATIGGDAGQSGGLVTLGNSVTAAKLVLAQVATATPYTIGASGDTTNILTLNNGLINQHSSGATFDSSGATAYPTINARITVAADQTWYSGHQSHVVINGAVNSAGRTLTLTPFTTNTSNGNTASSIVFNGNNSFGTLNIMNGNGQVIMTGTNTYTGGINMIQPGSATISGQFQVDTNTRLEVNGAAALGSAPIFIDNDARLDLNVSGTYSNNITIGYGGAIMGSSVPATISGNISGGGWEKVGNALTTLSGTNSFAQVYIASSGGPTLGVTSQASVGSANIILATSGMTVLNSITLTNNIGLRLATAGQPIRQMVDTLGNAVTLTGPITAGAVSAGFVKAGSGTLTITNGNGEYVGAYVSAGGLLIFTSMGATGVTTALTNAGGTSPTFVGSSSAVMAGAGASVGVTTGSLNTPFLAKINLGATAGYNNIKDEMPRADGGTNAIPFNTSSVGGLALASSDAATNIDFSVAPYNGDGVKGMSIGAIGGITYTGTISNPTSSNYRLGGGGTLTLPNNLALTGSNSVTITNGGTVVLSGSNGYSGDTTIEAPNGLANSQASGSQIDTTLVINSSDSLGSSTNGIIFNGGTLRLAGNVTGSTRKITLGAGGGTVDTNGFTGDFGDIDPGNFTKNGNGAMKVRNISANNLTINAGILHVRASAGATPASLLTGTLSIAANAQLDLDDNKMIVNYTGAGPGDNSPSATIRQYLINGRGGVGIGNASWAGTGGITSTAIVTDTDTDGLAVGYREAQPPDFDVDPVASFGGQTVDDTAILIRYTYSGDANLDGVVDRSDLLILQNSFNQTSGIDWLHGDFDYNGTCDRDDYNLLSNNYGNAALPSSGGLTASFGSDFAASLAGSRAAVPEPASVGFLALGALGLMARRRRRGRDEGRKQP